MKTIYIEYDKTKRDIIFSKFIEIGRKETFVVGLAYLKGKRIPHGIYGYFEDLQKNDLIMLAKSFHDIKNWQQTVENFKNDFAEMKSELILGIPLKNYKLFIKDHASL